MSCFIVWYEKNGKPCSVRCSSVEEAREAWDYANLKYNMISKRP